MQIPHKMSKNNFSKNCKNSELIVRASRAVFYAIGFSLKSLAIDNIPKKIYLLKKLHGKTFVLAGAIGGFHDPFFGFGINSALISGKIAAMTVVSRKKRGGGTRI